jgi:serine/threonine-protein kinase
MPKFVRGVMPESPAAPDPLYLAFQLALAGRYSIDRELGRGGMGVVYLAREVHLDRLVAIKLLPPALSIRPALRERFLREARMAAKLSHPNIIAIHSVEQTDDFVYYVMAYVDGETLAQRVQSRGPLSASEGVRILRDVAWALGYAHGQGLVHRDVKPDNILLEGGTGRALVADFGIAAAAGDLLGDGVSGTPEFMSPEQALGGHVDARSDLYSLGATAFYALSGRLPFEGATATEVLARQVTEAAPTLASVGSGAPRKLAKLIERCLAKNPDERPASAQLLSEQLLIAGEQRRELPVPLRAFVKRNGRMNGGGTLFALVGSLVAGVGISTIAGPVAGVALLAVGIAATPVVFGVIAAKRLLDLGFTRADLAPAFRAEQESSREERTFVRGTVRSAAEWILRSTARVSATTSTVVFALGLIGADASRFSSANFVALAGFTIASVATLGYVALLQMRRDVDVEFWTWAWTGRFGAAAFALARKWRGARPVGPAMTHRATELSLGMAAEQLYASLPKASREMLRELPDLLERLQSDAVALRRRYDDLQEALAESVNATGDEHSDTRAARDRIHDRLATTVGALETIRLSLLRLHAGSLTLEAFTTHIDQASEVSADVERLIAAQQEVDDTLRFPRDIELTPV